MKKRKKRDIVGQIKIPREKIDYLAKTLSKQINKELFEKKCAPAKEILKLVGAGFFFAGSLVAPNLPQLLKSHYQKNEHESYRRFNLPYLKRTLARLAKQKVVQISQENGQEVVKITDKGRIKILRCSLDEIEIKKPKDWDRKWLLASYDIPQELNSQRKIFQDYLNIWGFYPLHQSLYLHAYPCEKEVQFLKEYLGVGKYVRLFTVSAIENDRPFRKYFNV